MKLCQKLSKNPTSVDVNQLTVREHIRFVRENTTLFFLLLIGNATIYLRAYASHILYIVGKAKNNPHFPPLGRHCVPKV